MHRSGTSCLTGTLQEAGLFLGDCHTWNKHNEKGNRENQKFVDLHDAILEANAGAWDAPPTKVTWSAEHIAAAKQLLADHAGESNFGFKDPRALPVNFLSSRQPLITPLIHSPQYAQSIHRKAIFPVAISMQYNGLH